jgi:hypothetical protein
MNKYLLAIPSAMLFIALLDGLPYNYFKLLRIVVTISACLCAYLEWKKDRMPIAIMFGCIALIFNPLIPFHMQRDTWFFLDFAVGICFAFYGLWNLKELDHRSNTHPFALMLIKLDEIIKKNGPTCESVPNFYILEILSLLYNTKNTIFYKNLYILFEIYCFIISGVLISLKKIRPQGIHYFLFFSDAIKISNIIIEKIYGYNIRQITSFRYKEYKNYIDSEKNILELLNTNIKSHITHKKPMLENKEIRIENTNFVEDIKLITGTAMFFTECYPKLYEEIKLWADKKYIEYEKEIETE